MVQFHENIITDLLEDPNGGLVILSSGLSLPKLISSFVSLHHFSQGTLLILSASPSQKTRVLHHLHENFNSTSQFPQDLDAAHANSPNPKRPGITSCDPIIPSEITSDLHAHHRYALYESGAVFFITVRILIVDLLTCKLPTSKLAGLIILNAHMLTETCTEAFIVRIIRSLNKNAYIRAFSDKPHSMVSGFAKAERIMKCLFLRRLHLWPRFQVYVSQELERDPPVVVDIRVPMSKYMMGIQKAIIEVMDACLKEIRKTNKVDVDDLTVENGLFKSFDEIVRRQLDPIWHTLGRKTKQLVSDLKTLRKLLDYLVRYDAVTYLKYLDSLRASESFRSVWISAAPSYKIFEYAKKRVYNLVRSDGLRLSVMDKSVSSKKRKLKENNSDEKKDVGVVVEEVLEEPPKWKVLREIVEEIEQERQKQEFSGEDIFKADEDYDGVILVACKDERTCMQLESGILNGSTKVMREEWGKYLLSKVELKGIQTQKGKKGKEPKGIGVLDGLIPTKSGPNSEASILNKQEHDALVAIASKINNVVEGDTVEDNAGPDHAPGVQKNRKARSSKTLKKMEIPHSKNNKSGSKNTPSDKSKASGLEAEDQQDISEPKDASCSHEGIDKCEDERILLKHDQETDSTIMKGAKQLLPVHFYALESDQNILDIVKPSVIIVYHPDMTFVREIEIYKAENASKNLKVFFLFYDDSTEVQKFEASIRRENGAFESLIRQKSLMTIPVDQESHCLGLHFSVEQQASTSQNIITRKAGGRKEAEKEMQVIVDMREFMSSLPNVIHQKGMRIIPVTLEVGDYVLSPLICVERKSIQDLFMSFTSGRLYHQVETMVRYYKIPVLLIEFSQDKSFSFQSASDIGDDVTPNNIISKLSLLVLHFPRLRIIWSRSLHATAEIFSALKANQDEPDEAKALRVGVPSEEGIVENDVRAENYNTSAVEFLRRLPGVTDSNYRAIMDGCESLAELALLPVESLAVLMGGQKAARTLRDFLDAKYPVLL